MFDITLEQFLSHVLTKKDLTVYLSKYLKNYFEDYNCQSMREKRPYLELFWSVFSRIWTE